MHAMHAKNWDQFFWKVQTFSYPTPSRWWKNNKNSLLCVLFNFRKKFFFWKYWFLGGQFWDARITFKLAYRSEFLLFFHHRDGVEKLKLSTFQKNWSQFFWVHIYLKSACFGFFSKKYTQCTQKNLDQFFWKV